MLIWAATALAQPPVPPAPDAAERERQLLERIRALEERLAAVEARLPAPPPKVAPQTAVAPPPSSPTGDSLSLPGFAPGTTTVNLLMDGYYEYNSNAPVGRVNVLRPFDPTSNNFTLNQGALIVERAPDPAQGRRFGARLDLMFGQTTESLAGNPSNEPRFIPYLNIFQAYGTYVFPLGKGLNVDFGRFASSLGFEGSYTKDQINYTRSLLFNALPFYHVGFRTSYPIAPSTTFTWLVVNGINQMEDLNGFKSNHFMLTTALGKKVNWTGSYYSGKESRDLAQPPFVSNLPPPIPTQPFLSTDKVTPTPNGRTHIADTYLTWTATPELSLAAEADYIVSRLYSNSAPAHVTGAAGYLKYQIAPFFYVAGRFEYVSDRGGYLSGATQALKEGTLTMVYEPVAGFQMRWEYRRDYSNQPFALTSGPGLLKKEQNTALMGLLWWFGGKRGSW